MMPPCCASGWPPSSNCSTRPKRRWRRRRKATLSTFLGAFTILLREGLEALLVVIAMIAFLRKAERAEALPYVHGGWVAALIAGRRDLGRRDLCDRHQRRQPRADRRLRVAAGGGDPAVGRHLDARQEPGGGMAPLHQGKDAGGALARLGLVPVLPRLRRRLSRSVRDHPLLCGAMDARQWRDDPRRRPERRGAAGGDRLGDAALQPHAADHPILQI